MSSEASMTGALLFNILERLFGRGTDCQEDNG